MKLCNMRSAAVKAASKRGSYIMEASIVLPVLIFAVITVVLIIMFFYSQMTEQSRMHIAMRHEAGLAAGKTVYTGPDDGESISDAEIYTKKTVTGSRAYGKKYLIMDHRGILEKKGTFVLEGTCSSIDGARYVRYCSFVRGYDDEE